MQKVISLLEEQLTEELGQIVLSDQRVKSDKFKVKVRPVVIGEELRFQFTSYIGTKVMHENLAKQEAVSKITALLENEFKQMQLASTSVDASVLVSKKGKVTCKVRPLQKESGNGGVSGGGPTDMNSTNDGGDMHSDIREQLSHNRSKNYILKEGEPVPFLIDLGVQTKEGKIVKSKYDKFRQINRFLEFLEDIANELPKDRTVSILDFGCGKSYLTFAMYYYLKIKRNYDIDVVGLDLKKDVIAECNRLRDKYGYEKLHFLCGDIKEYREKEQVDMVVTLHACDTATDYALLKAVQWNAKVILSVPCCQHEINRQIQNEMLAPILKYGLLKERISALITDGIRANLLEELGYRTQILEFIDLENTPKNILIRAVKSDKMKRRSADAVSGLLEQLHTSQSLYTLLENYKKGVIS
ncbi:MAG: SAM-dependent methyltransferase [Lachnospiraceae bacterium]|nr:SAM-dependent methyltransferase [Lachnospiraceae bacterium]